MPLRIAPEKKQDEPDPGINEVFNFLMKSDEEVEEDKTYDTKFLRLATHDLSEGQTADPLTEVMEDRQKIIDMVTDQRLIDAGFIYLHLEQPDVRKDKSGNLRIFSFSKLGPAVLVELIEFDTRVWTPIKYEAALQRQNVNNEYVNRRLADELGAPVA